jgi:hypothetical protein
VAPNVYQNRLGVRFVLNKSLHEIEEGEHEENVRRKIKSKKYTMVEAKEKFDLPAIKTQRRAA